MKTSTIRTTSTVITNDRKRHECKNIGAFFFIVYLTGKRPLTK